MRELQGQSLRVVPHVTMSHGAQTKRDGIHRFSEIRATDIHVAICTWLLYLMAGAQRVRLNEMLSRRSRVALIGLMLVVACAIVIIPLRTSLLRAMGRFLVASDPLQHADVIVLSVDSDGSGVLEATDLVHQRVADRVALFADPPDAIDREFLRRGVAYHDAAAVSVGQLHDLGVDAVEVIPRAVAGTDEESGNLPAWCSDHGYRAVIFVSTLDHSRRTARILARATRGRGLTLAVRGSPYSEFDPDGWWKSRTGVRTEIIESEKLLADILMHPLS
jgi:hypothetical protein